MRIVPTKSDLERFVGMEYYATDCPGIGGVIRRSTEDFVVQEVLTNGLVAELEPRNPPPSDLSGGYVLCVLAKEGVDTLEAARVIAKELGVRERDIAYVGLKDARAKTAQFISIRGASSPVFVDVRVREARIRVWEVMKWKRIGLRDLWGNAFSITIRDVAGDTGDFLNQLEELGGLPNFFGHQRFGTIRPISHVVGKHLVKREFEQAVLTYLCAEFPYESDSVREIRRRIWDTRNFSVAEELPPRYFYEREIAKHLAKKPNDFLGALKRLPMRLLRLLVQAYQSYLFNKILSIRIAEGSWNTPIDGDYIALDKRGIPSSPAKRVESPVDDEVKRAIALGKLLHCIPTPGYGRKERPGRSGELEKKVLEEEGVSSRSFFIDELPKASAEPTLRPLVMRVFELTYRREEDSIWLSFELPRGCYATVLLRELMKPEDPVSAGY